MSLWPQPGQRAHARLSGPAGALDALVELPDAKPRAVAVVCHPHPQHGGAMTNKVTHTLARAAVEAGCAAMRFDFRGVGNSAGVYDYGVGEVEDALAAARWAQQTSGCDRLLLAGFSFGAAVALRAALRHAPVALVTVALPTAYFDNALPTPDCHWLAAHGSDDDVADPVAARNALCRLSPAPEMVRFADTGHFFHGRLGELRAVVSTRLQQWLAADG